MSVKTAFYDQENNSKNENKKCVILLEGLDDIYFISKLLLELKANPDEVGLMHVEGNSNFSSRLPLFFKKSPGFTQGKNQSVAIICDADDSYQEAKKKINEALREGGQPTLDSGTHVTNSRGIKIGLFIMPEPDQIGDLEKLCLSTVNGSALEKEAEKFIAAAEVNAVTTKISLNGSRYKRKAHVYLAGIPARVVRGAGMGYKEEFFDNTHTALDPIKDFLRNTIL